MLAHKVLKLTLVSDYLKQQVTITATVGVATGKIVSAYLRQF